MPVEVVPVACGLRKRDVTSVSVSLYLVRDKIAPAVKLLTKQLLLKNKNKNQEFELQIE